MRTGLEPRAHVLRDARSMAIAEATEADIQAIAREHPLPTEGDLPENALRAYYRLKTWLYVSAECAGVVTGMVDGELAGFVLYTHSVTDLRRQSRRLGTMAWCLRQLLLGRLGGPREWFAYARWGAQHFRAPERYQRPDAPNGATSVPEAEAQIGTVHTARKFRRIGVASALLSAAEANLRDGGASHAYLWAAVDNSPALRLYESSGYKRIRQFQRIGESCWLMSKGLVRGTEAKD